MSIKPIHAQVMINNSPDAAKMQNPHKTDNVQAQASQNMQKKIEHDAQDVANTNEAEKAKINKKQEEEKQQSNKKKKDNSNTSDSKEGKSPQNKTNAQKTSIIDIRI